MLHHLLTEEECVRVDRTLLPLLNDDGYLPAAIDCGTALIKIVYAAAAEEVDRCGLHFALFDAKQLTSALEFLKAKLQLLAREVGEVDGDTTGMRLRATGAGAWLHRDKISEQLGVEIDLVEESASHCAGFHFLVSHCSTADVCYPPPVIDESEFAGMKHADTFQQFCDAQVALMSQQSADSRFPCLFVVFGASAIVYRVNEDGSTEVKHRHALGGKSVLGACQLLAGTSDYCQAMLLAEAGKRGNIDTQIRDVLADTGDSNYGQIPMSVPMFAFGKAVDFDKTIEETRPEDIAQSVVCAFTANIAYPVSQLASFECLRNVYYGGGFFRNEFPRAEVIRSIKLFAAPEAMNLNFLKISHTAALGALLVSR